VADIDFASSENLQIYNVGQQLRTAGLNIAHRKPAASNCLLAILPRR
jgi:hypothetical protein